jgi:hypothetical protein
MLTVGSLCYKPIFASGASTVSPLFRILDSFRGTLVIDKGDFRLSDEQAEIVKILNNWNAKGFPVLRSEATASRGEFNPRAYEVYGPKLIATRGFFKDRALESRCLTEETGGRSLRDDIRSACRSRSKPRRRASETSCSSTASGITKRAGRAKRPIAGSSRASTKSSCRGSRW